VNGSLDVTVREVPEEPDLPPLGSSYLVTVHGADRLGIVARLAGVIAEAGGNITDLSTRLSGTLYVLVAEVDLPRSAEVMALQARLAEVSADLGVDTTMRLLENDQL
jgi:glycine cleavage system transcriptional repressor